MSLVRDFGATGDGATDDTAAILHALKDGDGHLQFARGTYKITKPIEIDLDKIGPVSIDGQGSNAKILMTAPGPAFFFKGTHAGTSRPNTVKPNVWKTERLASVSNIEIEGAHEKALGIQVTGVMQVNLHQVAVRNAFTGIFLTGRNRNVIVSNCQLFGNHNVGLLMDNLNLHQVNIIGSHISFNKFGGIRIENSEIRNLQITGNDIEYNNQPALAKKRLPTAEIYVDTTADKASVAEVTIASNTIQATPTAGGCNIRMLGRLEQVHRPGLWTITGNIIGNQETNLHITAGRAFSISGNSIYSAGHRNVLIENSREISLGQNHFRRHTPRLGCGVKWVNVTDSTINGNTFFDEAKEGQQSGASLLELEKCQRLAVTGNQFSDGVPYAIDAQQCADVLINGCQISETRKTAKGQAIRFAGPGARNLVTGCSLSTTGQPDKMLSLNDNAGVQVQNTFINGKQVGT